MLKYFETPVIEIKFKEAEEAELRVLIKREDLNHPLVSGNKWWKLKYNLREAKRLGFDTILTFGGAFSNHIYATAAAAKELNLKSIGVIRGEEFAASNATLRFATDVGMKLHFVSRTDYRKKNDASFIAKLKADFGVFYLIPEGGTNSLGAKGCEEFAKEKLSLIGFDYLCLPVGTGGTIAGIIKGLGGRKEIVGFSVLKNGNFLNQDVVKLLVPDYSGYVFPNWRICGDFHFGGYAKSSHELNRFIDRVMQKHQLPLDPVYTGKMAAGIVHLIKNNYFKKASTILILHTGGLRPKRIQ